MDTDHYNRFTGLYVHIPFCVSKCDYCSFVSEPVAAHDLDRYCQAVLSEARGRIATDAMFDTLYIGGGSPCVLGGGRLYDLITELKSIATFSSDAEVTVEVNPDLFSAAIIRSLTDAGVTRVSVGIQTLSSDLLSAIGRKQEADPHTVVATAQDAGFNVSVDLIYGLPGMELSTWERDLETVLSWQPHHLSLYPLEISENTPLHARVARFPDLVAAPDEQARQYDLARQMLCDYDHYEVSNWCLPGNECRHNLKYWRCEDYVGLGAAAHSLTVSSDGALREWNTDDIELYRMRSYGGHERLDRIEFSLDLMFMGLRLIEGVQLDIIEQWADVNMVYGRTLCEFQEQGLLIKDGDRIKLDCDALFISNQVVVAIVAAVDEYKKISPR